MEDEVLIAPAGMFGANEFDSALDTLLRQIGKKFQKEGEWGEKYGSFVDNETFMMHPYCWCDRDDCPWCGGCDCPEENFHYFVDGKECSYKEFVDFYDREVYQKLSDGKIRSMFESIESGYFDSPEKRKEFDLRADEVNKRRTTTHEAVCDYCLGNGIYAQFRGNAPNFWYKPLDFRVTWYKYIGRSTEINRQVTSEEFEKMRNDCLATR